MKIISKFRDYYDSAAQFGIDESHVFIRKNNVIDSKKAMQLYQDIIDNAPNSNPNIFRNPERWSAEFILIGFCGKIYPVYRLSPSNSNSEDSASYCYSVDDIETFFAEYDPDMLTSKKWLRKPSSKERRNDKHYFARQVIFEIFSRLSGSEVNSELFHSLNEPVWAIFPKSREQSYFKGYPLTINPILKDLNFMRTMDPFTAHQEISQYYFGVLGIKENTGLDIEDKYRIAGKGFDPRYGFRTRPNE